MSSLGNAELLMNQGIVDPSNSSFTNLTTALNSRTFTGGWFNATKYSQFTCIVNTNQSGNLYFDTSMDAITTDRIKNIPMTNTGGVHTLVIVAKYLRVRYIADADTTTFRLQSLFHKYKNKDLTTTLNQTISTSSDTLLTRPTNFNYEVALGRRTDHTTWNKFGYNNDVDSASAEVIAAFGGSFTPLTSATTLTIVSSSANDTSGGTGANSIIIYGVDSSRLSQTQVITLTGVTPVVTVTTWLGINRVAIYISGSGQVNAGSITITATTGGTTQALVPVGEGTSQQLIFFSQAGFTVLADWLLLNAEKVGGSSPNVQFKGWVYSAVSGSKYEVLRIRLDTATQGHIELRLSQPFIIGEKSCFWIEATTTVDNTEVSGRFSLIEVKN